MKKKYKIALVIATLTNGGLERVVSNYSQLFEKEGYEVEIFVLNSGIKYPISGKLHIYEIQKSSFLGKIKKYLQIKNDLEKGKFDIVIDHRVRLNPYAELMWKYIIFTKQKVIYFVHSVNIKYYLQPYNKIIHSFIFKKDKFICVSKGVEEKVNKIFPNLKTKTIYSPIIIDNYSIEEKNEIDCEFILAIARITTDNVKQVDIMLECYAKSILPKKGIKLIILGDGERKEEMQKYANKLGIGEKVEFKGFVNNPYPYLKKAYCTILTSKNEGLPTVLIESLFCGTPVVSFDCQSGPREIIQHENNGLLVENQNKKAFTQALDRVFTDKKLYQTMKKNAKQSVQKFSSKAIMKEWKNLNDIP